MSLTTPKATSVTEKGEPDGFEIALGWDRQVANEGDTRLLISAPTADLQRVHLALLEALGRPLAVLYRRCVDRKAPRDNGTPPDDFLAHELTLEQVQSALRTAGDLVWHDARCEVWVRGLMGEQIVLDQDGLLYAYPDDPSFREVLDRLAVPQVPDVPVLLDRDYVKHHFHAVCDDLEDQLIRELFMVAVAPQAPN